MSYQLILSSYQAFEDEKNILLLGDWCLNPQDIENKKNFKICKPYGLEKNKIVSDFFTCEKLFNSLIEDLRPELNQLHNINFSIRAWKIFLGPWLKRYVRLFFNRYHTLKQALENNKIDKVFIGDYNNYDFSSKDTKELYRASIFPEWDYMFFSRILDQIDSKIIESHKLEAKNEFNKRSEKDINPIKEKNFFFKTFYFFSKLICNINKSNSVFLKETYLRAINDVYLQLKLNQIPVLWENAIIDYPKRNIEIRKKIKITRSENSKLEELIRKYIPLDLPTYAIEGLESIKKKNKFLKWPKKPKSIYTANSFWGDEIFKYYVAKNVDSGSKYFVGQHGNSYGTRFSHDHSIEYVTCDKFITWGHKFNLKEISLANFCPAIKSKKYNQDGGLLMVNRGRPVRTRTYDRQNIFINYCKDIKKIVEKLPQSIKNMATIRNRPSSESENKNSNNYYAFLDKIDGIKISAEDEKITNLIKKNRLILFTFYSSGFLECLTKNIPTLCFDKEFLNLLKTEVQEDFNALLESQLAFNDEEKLLEFISLNWSKIDKWWGSEQLQSQRKFFVDKYCKVGNFNNLDELAKNLKLKILTDK